MYNNFSSKKTKKVISALLASALVVTSAPITADAATKKATYAVGVKKSVTKTVSSKIKSVTSSNKKIVTVKKTASKKYKITAKKTGSATVTVKYGKTTLKATIKVVAIGSIKKKSFATTLTAKQNKSVSATVTGATNAKYDTFAWTSSDKKVVTVSKSSTKMDSKKLVKNTLKPLKAGTTTITVKSKATGKKLEVKVNVAAASTATPTPTTTATTTPSTAPTEAPSATPDVSTEPAVSATPAPTETVSGDATPAPTEAVSGTATPAPTEVVSGTATPAPTATPDVPEFVTAAAISAAAVNTKTIAVAFNRDLTADEQAEVVKSENYSVVKDKATQNVKAEFKTADTLYITTATAGKFVAGTYTVTLKDAEPFTVTVEEQVATTLTIASSVVEATSKAAVTVSLLDQYNDDVALSSDDFKFTAVNKTNSAQKLSANVSNGKVYIETVNKDNLKKDDEIILTAVYTKKALTATKTLKVVEQDYVKTLTLGEIIKPATDTRITTTTKDLKVEYTAEKFYGDTTAIEIGDTKDYKVVSSDTAIVSEGDVTAVTDSTTKKNYINIAKFGDKDGVVTLVFINNKTLETVNVTITVEKAAGVPTDAVLDASEVTVAKGSKAYVGITIKDNYGDPIAAENVKDSDIALNASNDNVKIKLGKDKTKVTEYGKIEIDATDDAVAENSTVVCTVTVANKPYVLTVKVAEQAKPVSITATASVQKLLMGGTADITVSAIDQYAGVYDLTGSSYELVASVKNNVLKAVSNRKNKVTLSTEKAGTEVVTISIKSGDKEVASTELTFTVEANDATNFDYAAKDIAVLCPTGSAVGSGAYEQKVSVTATKKTDSSVVLDVPADQIKTVVSNKDAVKVVKKEDNTYYVVGDKDANKDIKEDVVATLTITILTDNGYQTVKKDVTVSKEAAKATKLVVSKNAIVSATSGAIEAVVTTDAAVDAVVTSQASIAANLVTVDQYGVASPVSKGTQVAVDITNKDGVSAATDGAVKATYEDGVIKVENIKVEKDNASFKVNILVGEVSTSFTVRFPKASN